MDRLLLFSRGKYYEVDKTASGRNFRGIMGYFHELFRRIRQAGSFSYHCYWLCGKCHLLINGIKGATLRNSLCYVGRLGNRRNIHLRYDPLSGEAVLATGYMNFYDSNWCHRIKTAGKRMNAAHV